MNKDQMIGAFDEDVRDQQRKADQPTTGAALRVERAVSQETSAFENAWDKTENLIHIACEETEARNKFKREVQLRRRFQGDGVSK